MPVESSALKIFSMFSISDKEIFLDLPTRMSRDVIGFRQYEPLNKRNAYSTIHVGIRSLKKVYERQKNVNRCGPPGRDKGRNNEWGST